MRVYVVRGGSSCSQHTLYIYFIRALNSSRNPRAYLFRGYSDFSFCGGRVGQIIKDIDSGSPAEVAGLKKNDLLVAVNGESVETLDHDSVVEMIRKGGDRTSLLVVDKETDNVYRLVSNTRPQMHAVRVGPFTLASKFGLSYYFVL
jgi:hypothetical protein